MRCEAQALISSPPHVLCPTRSQVGKANQKTRNPLLVGKEEVARRWALALRRRYPERHLTKYIARDFDVDPRTASSWIGSPSGDNAQVPYTMHIAKGAALFGPEFLAEIFYPGSFEHKAINTLTKIDELKRYIDEISNMIEEINGG